MAAEPIKLQLDETGGYTPGDYKRDNVSTAKGGYLLVVVQASTGSRYVEAFGFLNGRKVAAASAADNYAGNVISCAVQSFLMPVPPGASFSIASNANGGVSANWIDGF